MIIRIFYDNTRNVIWMSYRREPFAPDTLSATFSGDDIIVSQFMSDTILTVSYKNIADGSDPPKRFGSALECVNYLNIEFSKQRLMGSQYVQSNPQSVWTITHGLSFQPKVMIIDTSGDPVFTDTRYPSPGQVELRFAIPTSGTAYLS